MMRKRSYKFNSFGHGYKVTDDHIKISGQQKHIVCLIKRLKLVSLSVNNETDCCAEQILKEL